MKNNNPNLIVQWAVALIDFLLMNVLIYFILKFDDSAASTVLTKKLLVMIFNFTMLIAQYFYHTIILIRKLHIGRVAENVAKLTATQSILGFNFRESGSQIIPFPRRQQPFCHTHRQRSGKPAGLQRARL